MKRVLLIVLLVALLGIEPLLNEQRSALQLEEQGKATPTEVMLRFLGEIRYTLASYLWLKTEIYHHELGLTTLSSKVGVGDPKKIGELLAICRLVTRLDPGFVQAYDVGAWRLAQGLGKFVLAVDFLKEGLAHNPNSATLNIDLGLVYFLYLKDCKDAIPYLEKTVTLDKDRLEKGNALRLLGHCYKKEGRVHEAMASFQQLLVLFPDDSGVRAQLKALEKSAGKKQK